MFDDLSPLTLWTSRLQATALVLSLMLSGCSNRPPQRWIEPVSGIEFIRVPAGAFLMGSPRGEAGREDQESQHPVALEHDFFLGAYEVTQEQWQRIMGENPSRFSECGPRCPIERVHFHDVQRFIVRLETLAGRDFRLPTEAEWEYACRAGTSTPFSTGPSLTTDQANFHGGFPYPGTPGGIYRETPTPVGTFPPNPWGFFDMHGNVWEWTQDWHCPYPEGPVTDPLGSCQTELRVIRGGSWYFDANSSRCALRYTHREQDLGFSLGFRLAMEEPRREGR